MIVFRGNGGGEQKSVLMIVCSNVFSFLLSTKCHEIWMLFFSFSFDMLEQEWK